MGFGGCAVALLAWCAPAWAATAGPVPVPTTPAVVGSPDYQKTIRPFLESQCFECHDDTTQKGGLELDNLPADFSKPMIQQTWIDIFDKVAAGEMPPKKKPRPPEDRRQQLLTYLRDGITAADLAKRKTEGRVVLRRLNRSEYENTVRDLLGIHTELKDLLPEDASSMGFDDVAEALSVSSVLMERYLEAADAALDAAMPGDSATPSKHVSVPYGLVTKNKNDYRLKTGITTLPDGTFVMFNSGDLHINCDRFSAPVDGTYRIRVKAYAYQSPGASQIVGIIAGSFDPKRPERRVVGFYDVPPDAKQPRVIEFTEHLPKRGTFRLEAYKLGRRNLDQDAVKTYTGPGVAVAGVEVDGPLPAPSSIERSIQQLPNSVPAADAPSEAAKVLQPFTARAFRRPVTRDDVQPYLDLVKARLAAGDSFKDALRIPVSARNARQAGRLRDCVAALVFPLELDAGRYAVSTRSGSHANPPASASHPDRAHAERFPRPSLHARFCRPVARASPDRCDHARQAAVSGVRRCIAVVDG
jgi:hypothetical protein